MMIFTECSCQCVFAVGFSSPQPGVCCRGGSLPAPPRPLLCAIHSLFPLLTRVIINKESNSHVKVIHSYTVAAALAHETELDSADKRLHWH